MAAWTDDELSSIGAAEELDRRRRVRADGTAAGPVTIWIVRDGDDLYVRSVNGRDSSWFRGASAPRRRASAAGGVEKDVAGRDATTTNDAIDAAYRTQVRPPLLRSIAPTDRQRATRARRHCKLVPR